MWGDEELRRRIDNGWLAHVLTDTRDMFLPAVLTLTTYVALRVGISARARLPR